MIILKPHELKALPPLRWNHWRTPSQAQPKNSLGHENQTRFRLRAMTHDGVVRWVGWWDDRDEMDAFLWAMAEGTLRYQRELWDTPAETWMPQYGWGNVGWRPDFGEGLVYDFATVVFIVSGTTATVPSDSNGLSSGSGEFLDGIGAGGSGAFNTGFGGSASGGTGGAWSRITTISLSAGATVNVQAGAGGAAKSGATANGNNGTDTWYNKSAASAPASTTDGILAKAGSAGLTTGAAVSGGQAASGVGSSKNNGGGSGSASSGGSGGGGAASSAGAGGTSSNASSNGTQGGSSGSGLAGSAGFSSGGSGTTGAGGSGTEYDASHGAGSGSGGTFGTGNSSGVGGRYGAGSGGVGNFANGATGKGGDGLLVYSYNPVTAGGARFRAFIVGM